MTVLLDDHLRYFVQSPVAIVVATRDARFKPAIARGVAIRVGEDEFFDLFVSQLQWPQVIDDLSVKDAPVAITCSAPPTYETYQIKGTALAVKALDDEDRAIATVAISAAISMFTALGVGRSQIDQWITLEGLRRITIRTQAVFLQTPGSSAGQRRSEPA